MRATKQEQITVTLELTLDEACWLKNMMQNPIFADETKADNYFRSQFFTSLQEIGVL